MHIIIHRICGKRAGIATVASPPSLVWRGARTIGPTAGAWRPVTPLSPAVRIFRFLQLFMNK
jgi:hypothetical protein